MKLKNVTSVFGGKYTVDEDTRKLCDYNNAKRKITYMAKVMDSGFPDEYLISYEEEGIVDNIEDRLCKFANPLYDAYVQYVNFNRAKNDPDSEIYRRFIEEVKAKESQFFDENGDFKEKIDVRLDVFKR